MGTPEGTKCPFNSFEPCIKDDCALYIRMTGKDPNSGENINKGGCSIAWTPTLQLATNKAVGEQGAATEGLRNRIHDSNNITLAMIDTVKTGQLPRIEGDK